MDKKSLLLSKFRDSSLKIDPGEKVFLIHHDGSIVEREVDYVFCNMEDSLSIYIDGEGEFSEDKQDICFFRTNEEAKKFRDDMIAEFVIFVKSRFGRYYSAFDANYNFLMTGIIHAESLDATENFIDYVLDLDYLNESQFIFASVIHNDGYEIPIVGFAFYYVADGKSKKIAYPCLFKKPLSEVQEVSLKMAETDDPEKLYELFTEVFLTSTDILGF